VGVSELERRVRLEALFVEHAGAVRAYARRRIDIATADDTVSEVFVIAWRRLDDVPADALPWLLACARRVLANQRRGARRRSALADRLSSTHGSVAPRVDVEDGALARALAELSDRDREVLLLIAWEGLEPARAAAALECSRPALAVRMHRARRRLAAVIDRIECDDAARSPTLEAFR
jgi:RNA polymerase sigma-70 factor, ECF subfamily